MPSSSTTDRQPDSPIRPALDLANINAAVACFDHAMRKLAAEHPTGRTAAAIRATNRRAQRMRVTTPVRRHGVRRAARRSVPRATASRPTADPDPEPERAWPPILPTVLAAAYCSVDRSTLTRAASAGELTPYGRRGRTLTWRRSELDEWLRGQPSIAIVPPMNGPVKIARIGAATDARDRIRRAARGGR